MLLVGARKCGFVIAFMGVFTIQLQP